MRHKKIVITIVNHDKPWNSKGRTKRYKIDVRDVDNFGEALKEFGGMQGILRALNDRLMTHGMNTFRLAIKNGESVVNAKKLARNSRVPERFTRKKQHQILDKISTDDIAKMSSEDLKKMIGEIGMKI